MTAPVGGPTQAAPTGMESQSPGQMLRRERELRGLTVSQAADDLNLDRWIVEAIEADHFVALGAPVYARGHLRKYAALLGVPEDLIVSRYETLSGTPATPVVKTTTTARMPRNRKKRRYWRPALLLLLVAALLAAIGWWLLNRNSSTGTPASDATPATNSQQVGVIAAPLPAPTPAVQPAPVESAPAEKSK